MNHIDIPYDLLIPAVAVVLAAIFGAIGAWLMIGVNRKKVKADAADVLTGAALKLVQELQDQVVDYKKQVDEMESDIAELQCAVERQRGRIRVVTRFNARLLSGAAVLIAQLEESGLEPEWRIECEVAEDEELVAELRRLGNATE